jgi:hypothetical protein
LLFRRSAAKALPVFTFGFCVNCWKRSRFCFGSEFIRCLKVCDMSHEMAISIMSVSKVGQAAFGNQFEAAQFRCASSARPLKWHSKTCSTCFSDFALEFYTFLADNYAPFQSMPVECTDRDAAFVLDGLLLQRKRPGDRRTLYGYAWQHGTELRCIRHAGQGGSAHASRTCSTSTSIASTPKRITGSLLTLWAGLTAHAAHNGQTEPTPENNHENKNNISSS